MAKTIKVKVEADTEEAEGKFVKLQTRIRETKIALQQAVEAGDTQSINQLKGELDDLQDQFEKTTIQSKKFGDSLASVPGPAGAVGKAIKGLDDAFKFLIANPVVAVIAAVAAALLGMYKALQQTKEGQSALNKITDAFGNILNVVIKVVSAVAIPIFEAYAKVIGFVSSAVADATGNYVEYQKELAKDDAFREAEKQAEGIKKFLDEEGFKFDEITKKKIAAKQKYYEKSRDINKDESLNEAERNKKLNNAALELNKSIADADAERQKNKDSADKTAYDKATAAAEKAFAAKVARMSSEDKLDEAKLEKLKQEELAIATTEQQKLAIEELYSTKKYELEKTNLLQLQSLYSKDSKDYLDYQTQLISLDTTRTKDVADQADKRKKSREDENKENQAYTALLEDLYISTFEKAEQREDAQFAAKRGREKIALTADKNFIQESEDEKARLLQQFDDATAILQKERRQKRFEDEKTEASKHYSDLLQLLSIQGESLVRGTKAYNDNREAILKASQEKELNDIKVSADATIAEQERADAARTAINEKYTKLRKDQALQEGIFVAQQISQGLEAAKGVAEAILAVNENRMNEELKAAGDDEAKKEEIKKKYFEKNKKTQIALAYINTFQAAVSAFAAMAAIPVVGPALGAIAAAAAIVAGLANVAKIKASTYDGGNAGGAASAATPTVAMAAPSKAQVPTQEKSTVSAEGGIGAIVSKSSGVPQPTFTSMNTVLNKTASTPNIGSAISNTTVQAQATGNAVGQAVSKQEKPIQTYVVGSQVSSQQQLDRRVSLSARMGG